MSITDELREYTKHYSVAGSKKDTLLSSIADRIDAEHERMFHALTIDAEPMTDESMAEHGWVRLPVDADGETIHGGDEMCSMNGDVLGRVTGIGVCERTGWVWILRNGRNVSTGCDATTLRHHHVQTVEDVLREFARELDADAYGITDAKVAEFAAKLRLAGEGE